MACLYISGRIAAQLFNPKLAYTNWLKVRIGQCPERVKSLYHDYDQQALQVIDAIDKR